MIYLKGRIKFKIKDYRIIINLLLTPKPQNPKTPSSIWLIEVTMEKD